MVKSQPILRYILRALPAVAAAVMLSACSSPQASNVNNTQTEMRAVNDKDGLLLQASQDEFEAMVRNVDIKSKILEQYAGWKGVRYRLGGSSKRGIDCSHLYKPLSVNSLVWICRAQHLSSRISARKSSGLNYVQVILFYSAQAQQGVMSVSI